MPTCNLGDIEKLYGKAQLYDYQNDYMKEYTSWSTGSIREKVEDTYKWDYYSWDKYKPEIKPSKPETHKHLKMIRNQLACGMGKYAWYKNFAFTQKKHCVELLPNGLLRYFIDGIKNSDYSLEQFIDSTEWVLTDTLTFTEQAP